MDYLWTPWRYNYVSGAHKISGCILCDLPRAGNDAKVGIVHRGQHCYIVLNTFPYTSFSQNVGLVGVTGIRSRWVTAAGGVIMLILGLVPKMGALVEAVPQVVLGGAGLVMFGMVAATGVRILTAVDFSTNHYNLFVVAVSVGFGMIPIVAPGFFKALPHELQPLLESGILLAAIIAVILNAFFNGLKSSETADGRATIAAVAGEHP